MALLGPVCGLGCYRGAGGSLAPNNEVAAAVTAFVDVSVVPMDTDRVLAHQTVLVKGGRIAALGPAGRVRIPAGATRIDGQGRYLLPGLADMHAHAFVQDGDSAGAEYRLLRWLASGVTTIRDMHFAPNSDANEALTRRQRARANAGRLLSPRIYMSGPWGGEAAGRAADAARRIPAYKALGYDFVKIHDEDSATYRAVVAAARAARIPVAGHLPAGVTLERALRDGVRSIEHLYGYPQAVYNTVSAAAPTEAPSLGAMLAAIASARLRGDEISTGPLPSLAVIAAATRRAGVWNCPTQAQAELAADVSQRNGGDLALSTGESPAMHLVFGPPQMIVLRRRIIKALQDAGAGLLLGSDNRPRSRVSDTAVASLPPEVAAFLSGKGTDTLTVHDELAALVRAGLTPYQALVTGTRNPAVFLGTASATGTIAVGKRADLLLLEGNPLIDITQTARSVGVMIGGRWLARPELEQRLAAARGK